MEKIVTDNTTAKSLVGTVSISENRQKFREDYPALLDTEQAARILNVNVRTVTRMCATGKLKAVKVMSLWRINRDALLEYAGLN